MLYYGVQRDSLDGPRRCFIIEGCFFDSKEGGALTDETRIESCECSTLRGDEALPIAEHWCSEREAQEDLAPRKVCLDPGVYYGPRPDFVPRPGSPKWKLDQGKYSRAEQARLQGYVAAIS